ncbi:MAG: hypothetical protein U0625_12750 [Phycisphaerales bacterium]
MTEEQRAFSAAWSKLEAAWRSARTVWHDEQACAFERTVILEARDTVRVCENAMVELDRALEWAERAIDP